MMRLHSIKACLISGFCLMPAIVIGQESPTSDFDNLMDQSVILACQDGEETTLVGLYINDDATANDDGTINPDGTATTLTASEDDQIVLKFDGEALVHSSDGTVTIIHEEKLTMVSRNRNETSPCRFINEDLKDIYTGFLRLQEAALNSPADDQ